MGIMEGPGLAGLVAFAAALLDKAFHGRRTTTSTGRADAGTPSATDRPTPRGGTAATGGTGDALEDQMARLREVEQRFPGLADQCLVGVYLLREDRFLYVNQACAEIWGCSIPELMRMNPLDLVHPEDRGAVVERLQSRLQGEVDSTRYTFRGLRKDGTEVDIEVFGRRVMHEGRPAILGTGVDITERRLIETRFRALTEQSLAGICVFRLDRYSTSTRPMPTSGGTASTSWCGWDRWISSIRTIETLRPRESARGSKGTRRPRGTRFGGSVRTEPSLSSRASAAASSTRGGRPSWAPRSTSPPPSGRRSKSGSGRSSWPPSTAAPNTLRAASISSAWRTKSSGPASSRSGRASPGSPGTTRV